MTDAAQIERLLDAIQPIIDRHAESKEGSGLLHVPLRPHEMKELRSAFEPFRERSSSPKRRPQKLDFAGGVWDER